MKKICEFSGEKPLISKWCLSGEEVVTTPRTTPPPKPSYQPPSTTTPTPSYLPPGGEGDSKPNPNRQGKKLSEFVKQFNTKVSKKLNEEKEKEKEKDEEDEDDADEDEGDYNEEIGEDFVDSLADNYYYDYDKQEIKPKPRNDSKTGNVEQEDEEDQQVNPESSSVHPVTDKNETKGRNKNRKRKEGRVQKAEERSDRGPKDGRFDEKVDESKETVEKMKEKVDVNSLVFEETIPSKVKKIIDSNVRSDRKGNVKVARAKGKEANRSVIFFIYF